MSGQIILFFPQKIIGRAVQKYFRKANLVADFVVLGLFEWRVYWCVSSYLAYSLLVVKDLL